MNSKRKLERLFESARKETVPQPGDDFAGDVARAIRRETRAESTSLSEQLGNLFPRLAMASALVIALCVAMDYGLSNFVQRDLSTSAAEISQQWLFAVK